MSYGKSDHSDWFFLILGLDFAAIGIVCIETVISRALFRFQVPYSKLTIVGTTPP